MLKEKQEFRPFWLDQAMKKQGDPGVNRLASDIMVDVCIVGGGYTGLWTAILLKKESPELKIAVIEQECCGYGASGSNGGCILTLSTKFLTLKKLYGEAEAARIVRESENAVLQIKSFVEEHHISCDLRIDGALYMATNKSQQGTMGPVMKALSAANLEPWQRVPLNQASRFAGTRNLSEAYFSPTAGSVQPALLVRGMAGAARQMGVDIYEETPMTGLIQSRPPVVETPRGRIRAKKVVLAINAWMATRFKQFERSIAVVSSDMCITEPVPDLLENMGLTHGASICDSRIFVHYYHTTGDGRLMMGKGGNTFAYKSKILSSFFEPSRYEQQLQGAINKFFPALRSVSQTASWNGGSDRSVTGFPFFGSLDNHPAIFYGFGYSGNGVAQSYIGGQILRSLVLGKDDKWSNCGFTGGPRGVFPPEPVKWIGSMLVRDAIRRKEKAEDLDKKPLWVDKYLAGFAGAAGKADK